MLAKCRSGLRLIKGLVDLETIRILCSILELPNCPITELEFFGNRHLTLDIWKLLTTSLVKNTTVTFLNLSSNKLTDEFCPLLINLLWDDQSIRTLNLSHNLFTDEGIASLTWLFEYDRNQVTKLDLSYNCFGLQGTQEMFNVLETNRTLRTLDLRHNNYPIGEFDTFIGKEPIKADILDENHTILEVAISPWEPAFCSGCCRYGHRFKRIDADYHEGKVNYDSDCVVSGRYPFEDEYATEWIDWSDSENVELILNRNRARAAALCLLAIQRFRSQECLLGRVPRDVVLMIAKLVFYQKID